MKKNWMIVLAILIVLAVVAGCSKGYEAQRKAGDLNVTLKIENYPLVKGDNTMTIAVSDAAGKAVTDATVTVRFYMPPMPGMAPMDHTTQAILRGETYMMTVNAPMEGGWKAEVSVQQPEKEATATTFNLDAR